MRLEEMEGAILEEMQFVPGDLVTYVSPVHSYQLNRGTGKVIRENFGHYYIIWEDMPNMEVPHSKTPYYPDSQLIKVGDRVRNLDTKVEGEVTHLCDRCINITTDTNIESHNLELGKPKLKVLEKFNGRDNFPELLVVPKTHGYLEDYFVVNKQKKVYFYTRYVYQENSGKLKHYHVPKKQKESITSLWRSGATPKQICIALGKNSA